MRPSTNRTRALTLAGVPGLVLSVIGALLLVGCHKGIVANFTFRCASSADCIAGWTCDSAGTCAPEPGSVSPDAANADTPIESEVTAAPARKLDVLLVIDDSASMCQEQAQLASASATLVASLAAYDFRIAVVTTDVLSADKAGKFQLPNTSDYPFACAESRATPCLEANGGDAVCTTAFGSGWSCDGPSSDKQVLNCNGSVNSRCKRACTTDAECDGDSVLGGSVSRAATCASDATRCVYKCLKPAADHNGCVLRPPTADCLAAAERLTALGGMAYVTNSTAAAHLRCNVLVGAQQQNNANLESGLGAALLALDPTGANGPQAKAFLRPDADLAVVFVTDEDDCTTRPCMTGESCTSVSWLQLPKEKYGTCACLDDETTPGGPLRSVKNLANALGALKSSTKKTFVAAIIGDSVPGDAVTAGLDVAQARAAYRDSKCGVCAENPSGKHTMLFNTYMCSSPLGHADYGGRYVDFVTEFGSRGLVLNLCDPVGFGGSFAKLGQWLASQL